MADPAAMLGKYQKLIAGADLPAEEERGLIELIAREDPASLPQLCQLLANQKRQLSTRLAKASEAHTQAAAALAQLREPPWFPADVLHVYASGRVDVVASGRRQVVVAAPELDTAALRPADEVFLNRELTAAVARNDEPFRSGLVGVVAEVAGGRVVLRGIGDEEVVALCAPELLDRLHPGDRVVYRRETQCVIARLPERSESPFMLEQPPRVHFEDIGGLDSVIADIRRDLDLHLLHAEMVQTYRLRLMRGMTLVGPPGTGKTMLAAAIASYLQETRGDTRFLHVKPGALRGMYYGSTEQRIRELFAVARRFPGLVVIFFDEIDTFGTRGTGIGQDIDGRVLGALLAEIDGLEPADNVFCVGATNRLDLCDDALVREGRFKDRIYHIARPGREAARQILAKYLTPELPYFPDGDGTARAAALIDAAVSYLFAPQGGAAPLAMVTLSNSTRHEVTAPAVLSGALIAGAVERAKHVAAYRHTEADGGVRVEDVLAALDQALSAEADKLRAPHAARRILDFPGAEEVVRVELPAHRRPPRHRYLRAA